MPVEIAAGEPDVQLLTQQQVCHFVGFSKATLYRFVAGGSFPGPLRRVKRYVRWDRAACLAWKRGTWTPPAAAGQAEVGGRP